jgi:protein TonB
VKFTPPVIKKDEEVKEEDKPPKQEETKKIAIGNENIKGDENFKDDGPVKVVEETKHVEEVKPPPPATPLRHVEKEAQFPGGMNKLIDFLNKNLQYPDAERERGEEGTSTVEFVVDANGNISDVKVISSAGASFDKEAMRVVRMMPKWNPGMQGGQPVPSYYSLPVSYVLEGE